jgi:hypothetical protein
MLLRAAICISLSSPGDSSMREVAITKGAAPAGTLSGLVLLGWMERSDALRFLAEEVWPPFLPAAADDLWQKYRSRAQSFATRSPVNECFPLSEEEQAYAREFARYTENIGTEGVRLIKIDPMQLVVAQFFVVIDRAAEYAKDCGSQDGWQRIALPTQPRHVELNMNYVRRQFDTDIDIDLPHSEFIFGVHPDGGFGAKELLPYVSVIRAGNHLVLGKGYHRLYARMCMTEGEIPERLTLLALDAGALEPGQDTAHEKPFNIFGSGPALMADYFTEGLALPVQLIRKTYRLEVRARMKAIRHEA